MKCQKRESFLKLQCYYRTPFFSSLVLIHLDLISRQECELQSGALNIHVGFHRQTKWNMYSACT